jgi:hypothetical protein
MILGIEPVFIHILMKFDLSGRYVTPNVCS